MAASNLGMVLNETKEVEQEECGMVRMGRVWSETEHGDDGETRRETDRRNSELKTEKPKTETVFWNRL
jgi:hypothetical protein